MGYQVRFVADGSLPGGVEWAFARTARETYLFVTRSAIDETTGRCDAMSEAWTAYESMVGRSGPGPRRLAAVSSA